MKVIRLQFYPTLVLKKYFNRLSINNFLFNFINLKSNNLFKQESLIHGRSLVGMLFFRPIEYSSQGEINSTHNNDDK